MLQSGLTAPTEDANWWLRSAAGTSHLIDHRPQFDLTESSVEEFYTQSDSGSAFSEAATGGFVPNPLMGLDFLD